MPVHNIYQLFDVYDNKLLKMIKADTNEAQAEEDYSGVKLVGLDETSVRKHHVYVSLFVDIVKKRTIYVTEDKDHKVILDFVSDLVGHGGQPGNIEQVSYDMSPAFIKDVEDNLSNAAILFDRFHVSNVIKEAAYTFQRHWDGIVN
ncbi:MAG: transposase [Bacteroidales bacterium]